MGESRGRGGDWTGGVEGDVDVVSGVGGGGAEGGGGGDGGVFGV